MGVALSLGGPWSQCVLRVQTLPTANERKEGGGERTLGTKDRV